MDAFKVYAPITNNCAKQMHIYENQSGYFLAVCSRLRYFMTSSLFVGVNPTEIIWMIKKKIYNNECEF